MKHYSILSLCFCSLYALNIYAQQHKLANPSDKELERIFYGQYVQTVSRSGAVETSYRSLKNVSRSGTNKNKELSYAVYSGNFRKVQKLLSEGADVNAEPYPSCGPKGHPILLAVMSGSAAMTRLMIENGGDLNYTMPLPYLWDNEGWLKASLTDFAEELGRPDLVNILKSKKGLKGKIRNVGNLHEYIGFKPYSPGSALKPVQGRMVRNAITGKFENPIICRYNNSGISYGTLRTDTETGKIVCDRSDYRFHKSWYRDDPFEVLYHLKPLKKNQEIVWEVPHFKESGNEETFKYSFQPPDDKNVLFFCTSMMSYTMSGLDHMTFQACQQDKESYLKYDWYHYLLTMVEFDSDNSADDPKSVTELNAGLLKAVWNGNANEVRELLKSGADPNADNKGWTGLMYAAYSGKTDVIRVLLEYSADTTLKFQGFTALSMAEKRGNMEAAALLKPADRSLRPFVIPRSLIPEPPAKGVK